MRLHNWYDLDVKSDRSEKVRYSCTDIPVGFFSGHHSAYANNSMPAHWHEDIELFVPREGEVEYNINGKLVRVSPGEGLLLNSRRIHSSKTPDMRECYYNVLIFHPMLLCVSKEVEQQVVQPILYSSFDYVLLRKGTPWHENILRLFSLIKEKYDSRLFGGAYICASCNVVVDTHRKQAAKTAVVGLINLIWSEIAENIRPDDKPHDECSQLTAMKAMIAYIDAHYAEKIALEDIASAGFVSKRTCGNMFERFLYMPPMKYLNEYRLKRSIDLLKTTELTVTEIALACGFSGASYYAESFRRELGSSPSEYRRALAENGGKAVGVQALNIGT